MGKKLCVFVPEADCKPNDSVYWFDHPSTGFNEFDTKSVRVYASQDSENPVLRCHICKIKEVEESMTEIKMDRLRLKDEFSQFISK